MFPVYLTIQTTYVVIIDFSFTDSSTLNIARLTNAKLG